MAYLCGFKNNKWYRLTKNNARYPNVISETHKIKLLSSVLDRYGGYIWVEYTQTTVFEDGREFVYPIIRLRLSVENNEYGVLNVTKARIYSIYKR